jgi:hypothetical protein
MVLGPDARLIFQQAPPGSNIFLEAVNHLGISAAQFVLPEPCALD